MRRIAAISILTLSAFGTASAVADSAGAQEIPPPIDTAPAASEKAAAPAAAPLPATVIEPTTVTASSPAPARAPEAPPAPEPGHLVGASAVPTTKIINVYHPAAGRVTTQAHSTALVNRVVIELPAGVRVITRKDWYTDKVTVVYPSNTYTNWRGVTPDALVFTHEKETLRITSSGTKYVPKEITVYVRPSVDVQVR